MAGDDDLGGLAHRFATLLVVTIRILALPTGVVLMAQGGASAGTIVAFGAIASGWIAVSAVAELRLRTEQIRWRAGWMITGDGVLIVAAMGLTEGAESPLRLLLVPLPLVLGLVAAPFTVVAATVAVAVGYVLLGGPVGMLAALLVSLAWGLSMGVAVARQRGRAIARLLAVDDLRRSLADRRRTGQAVELAREVRETALSPVADLRDRLPSASRIELAGFAATVAQVTRGLRSVVVELHVLTARQGGLRASLEGLAQRRSPEADLVIEAPETLEDDLPRVATSIVAEALTAIADGQTQTLALRLLPCGEQVTVTVAATPPPAVEDPDRVRRFVAAATVAGASTANVERGTAWATLDGHQPARAPAWIPGRSLEDARLLVTLARGTSVVAAALAALVAGVNDLRFYLVAGALLALCPLVVGVLSDPQSTFRRWLLLAGLDLSGFVLLATLLVDDRNALLPLVVAIPICFGVTLAVPATLGASFAMLAGLVVVGFDSASFVVAFVWACLIGGLLAVGTTALDVGLVQLGRQRRELVRRLAGEEERRRRTLAGRLHDETLQLLLSARQDLEEAAAGDEPARPAAEAALAAAARSLEAVAVDLDAGPDALRHGARSALQELVDAATASGGPVVTLEAEDEPPAAHGGLVVRLAGELVANAVRHAQATRVVVRVTSAPGELRLQVVDDGRGLDRERVADAVARGHIGLASCRERVAAAGGSLDLRASPGGGTTVRVALPVPPREP